MSESGVSVWGKTAKLPQDPPLDRDDHADICVVGAGIAGLTTAFLLTKAGKRVLVLDANSAAASGETAFTTAHLACVLDDRFCEVERIHGEDKLRLAVQSHAAAIDLIESLATEGNMDCDFQRVDGYLFLGPGDDLTLLNKEADCAKRIGLAFEWADRAPFSRYDTGRCLRFPRQGQFHPLKYLQGVREGFLRMGGQLHGDSPVKKIEGGSPCQVHTRQGKIVTADAVVVATNTPINDVVSLHTKQAAYMTYAIAVTIRSGAVPPALYWDTLDPYHYLRLQAIDRDNELLIVGGEDHKTGQHDNPEKCWERLEEWTRARFHEAGEVRFRWMGQVLETIDGLAFIGPDPGGDENVWIATGDSGMGMTHGTIAGMILRDQLLGQANPWGELYSPSRKPMRAIGDYLRENVNVAGQYLDWMTGGDVSSADDVKPGHGAVLRRGLKKVALYRDEQGEAHECSAVCPHLGCIVHWNDAEKTWDCPCHGSRFNKEGKVVHGPAVSDLEPTRQPSHAS